MTKHTVFSATFVLLFTMAMAFNVRNSVTFDDSGLNCSEGSCGEVGPCDKKLQKIQTDCCEVYLREGSRISPSSPPLVMVTDEASSWREAFPRCCEQLEEVNKKCRCEAIERVVKQQMQSGQLQGLDQQEMLLNAKSLPVLCRLKKAQPCNISIPAPGPGTGTETGTGTGTGTGTSPSVPLF